MEIYETEDDPSIGGEDVQGGQGTVLGSVSGRVWGLWAEWEKMSGQIEEALREVLNGGWGGGGDSKTGEGGIREADDGGTGIWWQMLSEVDWLNEPVLLYLCGLQVALLGVVLWSIAEGQKRFTLQMILFFLLSGAASASERLNAFMADYALESMKEQYFDSFGFFLSVIYTVPLLIDICILVAGVMLIEIKRSQRRHNSGGERRTKKSHAEKRVKQ
eukprot:Nk52_evm17s367 gene=Nk52_evmTU17s367